MNIKWKYWLNNLQKRKAIILMYHSIAEPLMDCWELAVSPDNFEQQLQVLKKAGNVISIQQLFDQSTKHSVGKKSIVITFDDGYADNYVFAKPLLEKYKLPATFFVATGFIGNSHQFWWDELQNIILNTPLLPELCLLQVNGETFQYELTIDRELTDNQIKKNTHWVVSDPPSSLRCDLYLKLWQRLQQLSSIEQEQVLKRIRIWAGLREEIHSDNICMSADQLSSLGNHELFQLGTHSVTHPKLAALSEVEQRMEASESKKLLEQITGKKVLFFSYPYGNYNKSMINILANLDYLAAVTTEEKPVTGWSGNYEWGRFQVKNLSGNEMKQHLTNWFKLS